MFSNQPGLGHQANTSLSLASKKDRNRLGDGEGREIRAECQQVRASEALPWDTSLCSPGLPWEHEP